MGKNAFGTKYFRRMCTTQAKQVRRVRDRASCYAEVQGGCYVRACQGKSSKEVQTLPRNPHMPPFAGISL